MNNFRKFLIGLPLVVTVASLVVLFGVPESPGNTVDTELNFTFTYKLNIDKIPDGSKSVEIWLPLPIDNGYQKVLDYKISSELPYQIDVEPEYGNRIVRFSSGEDVPEDLEITVDINVVRYEQDGWNQIPYAASNDTPDLKRYLLPDVLVPIDGPVEAEAKQVVNGSMTTSQKIEALYYHLFETMKYDKSGIGWGHGDALYACESRKGNCTDIHSLFIGMARSLDIPSRFIMGFPLPQDKKRAEIPGYHCWAEFYVEGRGWVPVDISEAIKHPEKKDYFFGRLDAHRVAFTTGRDIKVNSGESSYSLNYFIYPYVLVDGQPFDGASYNFSYVQKN